MQMMEPVPKIVINENDPDYVSGIGRHGIGVSIATATNTQIKS